GSPCICHGLVRLPCFATRPPPTSRSPRSVVAGPLDSPAARADQVLASTGQAHVEDHGVTTSEHLLETGRLLKVSQRREVAIFPERHFRAMEDIPHTQSAGGLL